MTESPNPLRGTTVKLRVGRLQERLLASGHPWLFAAGVESIAGQGPPGAIGVVYDRRNRFLAAGLYDPGSPIVLRVLQLRKPAEIDAAWWRERVIAAVRKRDPIPATGTTGYRLLHGESDGTPALVADRYGEALVLKVYSAAVLPHLPAILEALLEQVPSGLAVLRLSRLLQSRPESTGQYREGQMLRGARPEHPVPFEECGLHFEANVLLGQKTGWFLDQRENRVRVGALAKGRSVLNVFSFAGGFSVHAAAGGATSVASLDISRHALEGAARSFVLNPGLQRVPHELIQADAFDALERLNREGRHFGLVVTDPPSFARNKTQREDALGAYRRLAQLASRLVERGGLLVSCSCSSQVSAEEFETAVEAGLGGRSFRLLERRGHSLDHPIGFPEARYLKALYHERC